MRRITGLVVIFVALHAPVFGQGQALFLNSAPEYLVVPGTPDLVPLTGLTVEAWVNYDPTTGWTSSTPTIVRKNPSDFAESYNLRRYSGSLQFIVRTTTDAQDVWTGVVSDSTWHHVAGTYDGSQMRTYIDGVLAGSEPLTGAIVASPAELRIGAGNLSVDENWQGWIDEVRIWSVARTAAEIQSTMNLPIQNAPNLIAAWHFEGDYTDSAGGHTVNLVGVPGFAPSSVASSPWVTVDPVAGIGAVIDFTLNSLDPVYPYVFELSVTGTSPGQAIGDGRFFPLNPPNLFLDYGTSFPGVFSGFFGFTDVNGRANPQMFVPNAPGLIGYRFDSAFVTLDPTASMNVRGISQPSSTVLSGPPPVLTGVTPNVAPIGGGTTITVTGANFVPGSQVRFGTALSTSVTFVNAGTLTCVSPAGTISTVSITVTNPDGIAATLPAALTYTPTLSITSITPLTNLIAGTPITIFGNGFIPGTTLSVAGQPVTPTLMSINNVIYPNPPNLGCSAAVVVSSPTGESAIRFYNPNPLVAIVIPNSVPSAGGTFVNLTGAFPTGCTVTLDGMPMTLTLQSPTLLRFVSPPHAVGPAPVVVTTPNGCTTTVNLNYF